MLVSGYSGASASGGRDKECWYRFILELPLPMEETRKVSVGLMAILHSSSRIHLLIPTHRRIQWISVENWG